MTKHVLLFTLLFYSSTILAAPKADRRIVTPGETTVKITLSKTAPTVMKVMPAAAFVRVFHAVPDGPKMDVFNSSLKIASNRGFTGLSSYVSVKIGKNVIKVVDTTQNSRIIATNSFNFNRGKYYTLAIYGKKAPQLLSINESTGRASADKAKVRVIHLAIGAPELLITSPSTRSESGYAKFLPKPLQYGRAGSKTFKPKSIGLQIRTTEGQLLKELPLFSFDAGKRYNAFIIGEVENSKAVSLDVLIKSASE